MRLRRAVPDDVAQLLEIDAACFPEDLEDRQPVDPTEIATGVGQGHVVVAEDRTGILGFIQIDLPGEQHLYIVAVDVRPDAQRLGVGSRLLEHVLGMVPADDLTVSSIAGTHNLGMLRLLLGHGFVVSAVMRDYHGPGNDRFYCQYRTHNGFADRENVYLIPATNPGSVYRLLDSPDHVVTAIVTSASSGLAMYEVSRVELGDRSAEQATESTAGIIFSGVMLLAVLLVCGLIWSSGPDPLVMMTVPMLMASIGALVVRVASTGDSIRRGASSLESQMVWGGVLTEYGAVIPIVLAVPAVLGLTYRSDVATIAMGIGASVVLIAYEFSGFSVQSRYPGWIIMWLLAILTSVLPTVGALLTVTIDGAGDLWWSWAVVAVVSLAVRAILMGRSASRRVV